MRGSQAYLCGPTTDKIPHLGNFKTLYRSITDFYQSRKPLRYGLRHRRTRGTLMMNFTDLSESVIKAARENQKTLAQHNHQIITHTIRTLRRLGLRPWVLDLRRCSFESKTLRSYLRLILDKVSTDCQHTQGGIWYTPHSWPRSQGFHLWRTGFHLNNPLFGPSLPGWHLECAALNHRYGHRDLVHYGGTDLEGIHHKNQAHLLGLTRSTHLTWRRVGPLLIQDLKMSKSKGNVVLINPQSRDLGALKTLFQRGPMAKTSKFSWEDWSRRRMEIKPLTRIPRPIHGWFMKRKIYKTRNQFLGADRIRSKIKAKGYEIQDLLARSIIYKPSIQDCPILRTESLNNFNEG